MTGFSPEHWRRGIAFLLATGIVFGIWQLAAGIRAARTATLAGARQERQWRKLIAQETPPSPAQIQAVEAALASARSSLAALCVQLATGEPEAPPGTSRPPPATRTEAFFHVAGFCRRMRELMQQAGVQLRPDEQFGFAAEAGAPPPADLVPEVERQEHIAAALLERLAAARPRQLLALQRTRPGALSAPAAARKSPAGEADGFAVEPGLSVAEKGLVTTDGIRLVFVGQTPALRLFLNGLAAGDLPVVVRSVAVEPAGAGGSPRAPTGGGAEPLVLVARPEASRFTVTMEAYALVAPPSGSTPPAAPAAPASWPNPTAQARGRGWIYELFAPPPLYVDRRTGVVSAGAPPGVPGADAHFELELVQVRRARFRWQLVGYAAGATGLRGIFADAEGGGTVLAGAGDRLAETADVVADLSLDRPESGLEGTPVEGAVAVAAVLAGGGGEPVRLTSREPCEAGAPQGSFASRANPAFRRVLKEGDSVTLNGADYCVEQLELRPPRAVVARLAPGDSEPVVVALTPRPAASNAPEARAGHPPGSP